MKCWVCAREARGLGHADTRFRPGEAARCPTDWAFCSRRCQDLFAALYGQWAATNPPRKESFMVDATEHERAAMRACLKAFGEAADVIGFDKALGAYSEAEALAVIEAIVTGFTAAMVEQRAAHVGGKAAGAGFADFKDDLPWEA